MVIIIFLFKKKILNSFSENYITEPSLKRTRSAFLGKFKKFIKLIFRHYGKLYENGMNGIRINSSHGTREFHKSIIEESRKVNPDGYIVYDIKGPKIRLGDIPEQLHVKAGDVVVLRTDVSKPEGSDYPRVSSFDNGIPVTYGKYLSLTYDP